MQGSNSNAAEIKGGLGTIKAGKIITGKGPLTPATADLDRKSPPVGLAQRIREGAKKMAAFAATIINLLFVLPLAQTLSQTLLFKGGWIRIYRFL